MFPQSQMDDYRRRAQRDAIANALRPPRQPFDERLPNGDSVNDLLRPGRIRSGIGPTVTDKPQPALSSPRIAISSQPATGIAGALNLPRPADPTEIRPTGDAEIRMPEVTAPPSPTIGPSVRGRGKLDRDIMLREAMSAADPESQVRVRGDQIDVSPPPMKGVGRRGRFATAGEAALNALGSGDPDRPLYSLGQALGGAITGAISPRAGAKINRRFDLQRLDNDIARGLKLESAQSELASAEALRRNRELDPILQMRKMEQDTEYRNAQLELERQKAIGAIDQHTYERERDRLNRESRERIAAEGRVSRERIAGMRGTSNGDEARGAKAAAAQAEYDQLVHDETEAGKQKDAAYAALEELKKSPPPRRLGQLDPQYEKNLAAAQRTADEANKLYQSFAEKKRDAQRRLRENQYSTSPAVRNPPPPPNVTEASVRAEAKRRGQNEDEAVRKAKVFGWIP